MKINIRLDNESFISEINRGDSLLTAINKAGVQGFDAPCGGKGTCGKCRIRILNHGNEDSEAAGLRSPDEIEHRFLGSGDLAAGVRLACRVFPETDMEIAVASSGKQAVIQSAFTGDIDTKVIADESACRKQYFELPLPSIEDQRSDIERLSCAVGTEGGRRFGLPPARIRTLPGILRSNDFKITLTRFFDEWIAVEGGDARGELFAAAVDIGTTTVVAYLVGISGLNRGKIIDFVSGLNSQKGYGGDVISRIEFCMQNDSGLEELHDRITKQITVMVKELASRNSLEPSDIGLITVAGNTTMTHLFAGLDPKGIAAAPFIPVVNGMCTGRASDFGLNLPSVCSCVILPGIASYVGSDITSGITATGIHESEELCLLIDIGTNGEIVLGNRNGMTACSTAAGPALEGANISCGMGGIPGAINRLTAGEDGGKEVFSFDVIGNTVASGLCGSGIVDAVALFVEAGVIDETGRILNREELEKNGIQQSWINCLTEKDGSNAVRITENIFLTQKDIREIQMAKAAISAGVKTLLAETGRTTADIDRLYIAGGFGAAMNKHSAALIGLFPEELEEAVVVAGNTAGKGAVLSALSERVLYDMESIAGEVNYIELSTSALFQQEYMMAMYF